MRLAWFSPMPPTVSGVAVCSADVVPRLAAGHEIDLFVGATAPRANGRLHSAHDFIWRHQQAPYDLTIYQIGNSAHHEYQWPYLFRFPGLAVLHDARLHHARAAALLRERRAGDYRAEFAANHPEASADAAELAIAGFDNHLLYWTSMVRLVARASKAVAVHGQAAAAELSRDVPDLPIDVIRLGHGQPSGPGAAERARQRYGIPPDAVVFGCFGGLSPEKRLPQILAAFGAIRPQVPAAHLLLAGQAPGHYALEEDVRRNGVQECTTMTGYLESDQELTACIAAADVALALRWPTARETSGPWLRCLAAGKPTVILHLAHLVDVPALDPRDWRPTTRVAAGGGPGEPEPVCVAVDILDEDHSLRLAMRRLGRDATLRSRLGAAASGYWQKHHSIDGMVEDYRRIIPAAAARSVPAVPLPAHLINDGDRGVRRLLEPFGLSSPLG